MKEFDSLVKIVDILRSEKGCPWDRAQKIKDVKKYLIEEVYELIDAVEGNRKNLVKEELGDVLFILIFISYLYEEKGKFGIKEVLAGINRKMILRHPHVFSSRKLSSKEEVLKYWIKSKAKQKNRNTVKDRLPKGAPSLVLADILLKESTNLGGAKEGGRVENAKIFSELKDKIECLGRGKNRIKLMQDAVFLLCRLAFIYGIDLESILKKKVIKDASRVSYKK